MHICAVCLVLFPEETNWEENVAENTKTQHFGRGGYHILQAFLPVVLPLQLQCIVEMRCEVTQDWVLLVVDEAIA